MRRIQVKVHKIETYEIDKISLSFHRFHFIIISYHRFVLDDEIHTLAYFHKDSVTGCKKN